MARRQWPDDQCYQLLKVVFQWFQIQQSVVVCHFLLICSERLRPDVTPSRYCIKCLSGSLFKCSKQIDHQRYFPKDFQLSNNSFFSTCVHICAVAISYTKAVKIEVMRRTKFDESLKNAFCFSTVECGMTKTLI